MADLDMAITAANEWQQHAAPIIRKYLAMEDVAFFSDAICAVHYKTDAISKAKARDYREASNTIIVAQNKLHAMLEGIRDMYYCDNCRSYSQGMSESEEDALIAFNDALSEGIISVEAAVKIVEDGL